MVDNIVYDYIAPAININSSNVILDLNNQPMVFAGTFSGFIVSAIVINPGFSNIVILNGHISNFNGHGINIVGKNKNVKIFDTRLHQNILSGLYAFECTNANIKNCYFSENNNYGLQIINCENVKVVNCCAENQVGENSYGFYSSNGTGNLFKKCEARCNISNEESAGFYLLNGESKTKIYKCSSCLNKSMLGISYGIKIGDSIGKDCFDIKIEYCVLESNLGKIGQFGLLDLGQNDTTTKLMGNVSKYHGRIFLGSQMVTAKQMNYKLNYNDETYLNYLFEEFSNVNLGLNYSINLLLLFTTYIYCEESSLPNRFSPTYPSGTTVGVSVSQPIHQLAVTANKANAVMYTISSPGRYYISNDINLTDITGVTPVTAIAINSSDVVLDLNGKAIFSDNSGGGTLNCIAIAAGVSNVSIINGEIRNFTGSAIRVNGATSRSIQIQNLLVVGCGNSGINVVGATSGLEISSVDAIANTGSGISLSSVTDSVLEDISAIGNTISTSAPTSGISLSSCSNISFKKCIASSNTSSSSATSVSGFNISNSPNCSFYDCSAQGNNS
ncbi:MAG: right-handed parallel beta-helix repeat-containing protein, partial [Burkholderiales bacterium]|nr:right-handed parallel beta-helix repeat-containing protein [Burkholderiales bacterium]